MNSQYQLKLKSEENEKIYSFESADGINSKNSFRDEEILLADRVPIEKSDRVLIIQSGYGFLGTVLGDKAEKSVMYETSSRAATFSQLNAENNKIENFEVLNKPEISTIERVFDKIIYAPANYTPIDLVKKRIAQATAKIADEGKLYIAGRNKTGLKRYRNFLKQFSNSEKIGKRDRIKAYAFSQFTETPEVNVEKSFKANLHGDELKFKTSEGLFSSGKIDEGTRILLDNIQLNNPDKILDLACGYGAITTSLAQNQETNFYLTDDNARATKYAEKNMIQNEVENHQIETADCLDAFQDEKFDLIVSNPPTHQGKGITSKIFSQVAKCLEQGGEFWLVYNKNMNYENQLSEKFAEVAVKSQRDNFNVVRATK